MAFLAAALLIKKILIKKFVSHIGLSYASGLLREVVENPAARHALERVADEFGWDGAHDLVDFLVEHIPTVGDLINKLTHTH
jgi:hypothetical protein